ncbi:MAG: hypothetical protein IT427_09595 [Pirellulales bacterium]|nr:hypothetical protein [Pirellulales bacterium]
MSPNRANNLYRFFAGLTEYAFQSRIGIADPPLVEYLTDLLTRFVRLDAVLSLRSLAGRPLSEVAEMLLEAESRVGDARRQAHRHIGDFTLFWTGVYPEVLDRLQRTSRKDFFIDYCQQGKRSYLIASAIHTGDRDEEGEVLQRLSHDFELCVYGLGEVRREWERREPDAPAGPIVLD